MSPHPEPLPVHGFVLAGGKSSRMGRDKTLLPFRGRPMVEIAVEKLRSFCAKVSIAGNRDDLAAYAPIVHETRIGVGPAAAFEAGLRASVHPWALFLPVDTPLLPPALLRHWAEEVLAGASAGCRVSYMRAAGQRHPATCLLHADCAPTIAEALASSVFKLDAIFDCIRSNRGPETVWVSDAAHIALPAKPSVEELTRWFCNINTPEELAAAETHGMGDSPHLVAAGKDRE